MSHRTVEIAVSEGIHPFIESNQPAKKERRRKTFDTIRMKNFDEKDSRPRSSSFRKERHLEDFPRRERREMNIFYLI